MVVSSKSQSVTPGKAGHVKHVPMRTCIACRQVRAKRDLVRVVHTQANRVQVDPSGKLAGRGAYVCRARECWDQMLKGHRLNSALRATVSSEDMGMLAKFAASLPPTLPSAAC